MVWSAEIHFYPLFTKLDCDDFSTLRGMPHDDPVCLLSLHRCTLLPPCGVQGVRASYAARQQQPNGGLQPGKDDTVDDYSKSRVAGGVRLGPPSMSGWRPIQLKRNYVVLIYRGFWRRFVGI